MLAEWVVCTPLLAIGQRARGWLRAGYREWPMGGDLPKYIRGVFQKRHFAVIDDLFLLTKMEVDKSGGSE